MATIEVKSESEFLVRLTPDEIERFKKAAKHMELTYVNLVARVIHGVLNFVNNIDFV